MGRQKQRKFYLDRESADSGRRRTKRRQTRVNGSKGTTSVRIADLIEWGKKND